MTYTPYADEAMAAVDEGEADSAFLVRAPTIAQVAEFAARGETMPQKSTYFFPKLTSGLLLCIRCEPDVPAGSSCAAPPSRT